MRINAVIALSVPPERRYYGNTYSHVYTALIGALKGTEKITEFSEFKYRDSLRQQVWSQGLFLQFYQRHMFSQPPYLYLPRVLSGFSDCQDLLRLERSVPIGEGILFGSV